MKDILGELDHRRAVARAGGGQTRVAAQHAKGKLTARERVELLLDARASCGDWVGAHTSTVPLITRANATTGSICACDR